MLSTANILGNWGASVLVLKRGDLSSIPQHLLLRGSTKQQVKDKNKKLQSSYPRGCYSKELGATLSIAHKKCVASGKPFFSLSPAIKSVSTRESSMVSSTLTTLTLCLNFQEIQEEKISNIVMPHKKFSFT